MSDSGMYDTKIRVDLTALSWTRNLWEKFITQLCKKSYKVESGEMGEVLFLKNNARLSDYQIQTFIRTSVSEFLDQEQAYMPIEIYDPKRVRLSVTPNVDSDTYLRYSTRLAGLQMNPEIAEWILQYFINIRFSYQEKHFDYFFFDEEIKEAMYQYPCGYKAVDEQGGIVTYLRDNLDRRRYVTVHLDEYYVVNTDYYQKRHHVAEVLFHGYDDEKQLFYVYGFVKGQRATVFTIEYQELVVAYEKGKIFSFFDGGFREEGDSWPVLSYFPHNPPHYRLNPEDFCQKLLEYLKPRANQLLQNDYFVYGINVVQEIIQTLKGDTFSEFMDYRALHLLYEHKKAVRRRLQMLEIRYDMPEEVPKLFQEYDKITSAFRGIDIVYLKQSRRESGLWNYEKRVREPKIRERVADLLDKYSYEEQELLWKIKDALEEFTK